MQKLPEVPDGKKGRCMHKEKEQPLDLEEQAFFLYTCVIPFSHQGPLGVSANLSFPSFFLIQFKFFYLFIRSLQDTKEIYLA